MIGNYLFYYEWTAEEERRLPFNNGNDQTIPVGELTGLSCDPRWIPDIYHINGVHWSELSTLREVVCNIRTLNSDLRDVLYTTNGRQPTDGSHYNVSVDFFIQFAHSFCLGLGPIGPVRFMYNYTKDEPYGTFLPFIYNLTSDQKPYYGEPYYGLRLYLWNPETQPKNRITIEYSRSNMEYIVVYGKYPNIRDICAYVPDFVFPYFDPSNSSIPRTEELVVNFQDPNSGFARRAKFMQKMIALGFPLALRNDLQYDGLKLLWERTKILLNVHQEYTDHSVEELRILQALRRGVVVVSETVPLIEEIPYRDYVIWSTMDDFPKVVNHTIQNYDQIYERMFGSNSKVTEIFDNMSKEAVINLERAIRSSLQKQRPE